MRRHDRVTVVPCRVVSRIKGVLHARKHANTHTHWYFVQKVNPFDSENKMSCLHTLLSSAFNTFSTYHGLKNVLCIYQWTVVIRNRILEYNEYIHLKQCTSRSPDSSVGIATCYRLDGPGIESRVGGEIFRTCPDRF